MLLWGLLGIVSESKDTTNSFNLIVCDVSQFNTRRVLGECTVLKWSTCRKHCNKEWLMKATLETYLLIVNNSV